MATKGLTDAQAAALLGYPPAFDPTDTKGTPRELLVNIKKGIAPTLKKGLEDQQAGEITIPRLARGVLQGTLVDDLNNQLSHSCDFILESRKNLKLREFIAAIAKSIKDGIIALSTALGLDPTGTLAREIAFLRKMTSYLKYIKKNYIDPIIEFQKYVIMYIAEIKRLIEFINNLPAKIKAILQNCLKQLIRLLNSIFTDIVSDAIGGDDGIGAAISSAQELAAQATETFNGVQTIIKTGSTIIDEVKSIDLNIKTPDFSDILPSKESIEAYIKTVPNSVAVQLANPPPQQQRSSP